VSLSFHMPHTTCHSRPLSTDHGQAGVGWYMLFDHGWRPMRSEDCTNGSCLSLTHYSEQHIYQETLEEGNFGRSFHCAHLVTGTCGTSAASGQAHALDNALLEPISLPSMMRVAPGLQDCQLCELSYCSVKQLKHNQGRISHLYNDM